MAITTLSDVVIELKQQKSIQEDTSIAIEKLVVRFNEFLTMQETLNMKLLETEREKEKPSIEPKTKDEPETEKVEAEGLVQKIALAAGILVGYLTETFAQIGNLFRIFFLRIKGVFGEGGRLQKVGDAFRKTIELFTKGLNAIRGAFGEGGRLQKVGDGFRKVIGVFRRAITAIIRPFKAFADGMKALGFFGGGGPGGKIFSTIIASISKVFNFGKLIGSVFARLNVVFLAIIGIWEGITGFIDGFKEKTGSFFDKVISGAFQAITDIVNAIVFSLVDMGKNLIAWILDKLGFDGLAEMLRSFSFQDIFSAIMEGFESIFLGVKDFFVGLFKGVTTGDFSQMFKGLFAIGDVFKMIGEKFLDLIRGAIKAILPDKDSWFGKVIPDAVYKFLEEPPPAETTPPAAPEPAPINENSEALAADPATLEPLMQSAAVMTPEQREELARVNPALRPAMEERGLLEASAPVTVPVAATASAFPGRQETAISSPPTIPETSVVPGIVYDTSSPENFIANNRDELRTEAIRQAQIRAASGQSSTGTPGAGTQKVTGGVTETGGDSTVRSYGAHTFTDTEESRALLSESRALDAEADRLQAEFDEKTSADQRYMLTEEGIAVGNRIHQLRLDAQSKKIELRGEDTITRYPPRTTGANMNQTSIENTAMSGAPALAVNAPTTNVNNSSTSNTAVSTGMPSASDSQDRSHLNSRVGW